MSWFHDLSAGTKHALDYVVLGCGGLAVGLSLAQVALIVSIVAGLISIFLGGMRVHDRFRYGPPQRGEG